MKITDLKEYSVVSKGRSQPATQVAETQQQTDTDIPFLQQVGTGAAKELASTGLGIGQIGRGIQKILSSGVDLVTGTKGFGLGEPSILDKGSEAELKAREALTPQGAGEKIGAFGAELATFAIPGGAATKATKGANVLTRAGALGATDITTAAIQQGEFNKEAVDAGIIAAAFPVVGKAGQLAKGALPSGSDAGGRVINSLIKPLLKDFSYGKNPGKAVAEAGITANSLDELGSKIKVARQQVGEEISNKISQNTDQFDATDALKSLDEAIANAKKAPSTNAAIINRLEGVKSDLLQIGEDGVPKRKLTDMTANELWEFNKEIGDLARWTGNASDDEIVNKAIRNAYGATRSKLDNAVDGLEEVSEKYANLKSAEVATEYRDKIAARQNMISFSGTQLGTAAAVTSAVVSGGAVAPILIGAGAAASTEALKSPAVKTRVAAWLASAPPEEVADAFQKAPWLRGAIQATLLGEEE